jgi:ribonuclease D
MSAVPNPIFRNGVADAGAVDDGEQPDQAATTPAGAPAAAAADSAAAHSGGAEADRAVSDGVEADGAEAGGAEAGGAEAGGAEAGPTAAGGVATGAAGDGPDEADEADEAEPERTSVPLTEPRDGLPPLVTTAEALDEAVRALAAGTGPVAVDAERASGFRYGHRAFLVQLRREGAGTVLIDPVACPDLTSLDAALADTEAVLHAASQDLPCLAELNYRPRVIFDTELAGRLLGYPRVGLATMVEELLGLRLAKTHSAADWSTRPLPEEWLQYAALDVEVLVDLRDLLALQLTEQGKLEWALQEFAAELAAGPPPPRVDPWRRTSGIHRVRNRRGLAVIRELWQERDRIAQQRDLSPTKVLPDRAIVEAARSAAAGNQALTDIAGFTGRGAKRYLADWSAAVARARATPEKSLPESSAPPTDGPPPAHRWADRDPEAARRLTAVRGAVAALADANGMPTENLLPPDAVRRLSWQPPADDTPGSVGAELRSYGARPWQVELTAVPISRALQRVEEKGDD